MTSLLSTSAMAQLTVMISGGFNGPYQKLLPQFEKDTGITVTTLSGASQGSGPKTIKAQLATGVHVDAVILSREGLAELIGQGKIIPGSDIDLGNAPLGAAVPAGAPHPDISTMDSFKKSLLKIKTVAVPGSTSGIYLVNELFPKMGISQQISVQVTERGSQATSLLAAKSVGIALQPTSELFDVVGIEFIGRLPKEAQLIQTFTAAIVMGSKETVAAKKLIALLSSPEAVPIIQNSGLDPVPK